MKYYTSQEHFERIFKETNRSHTFHASNEEEYKVWSHSLRKKLHELLGTKEMEPCEFSPEIIEMTQCGSYIRKKIVIHTEKDVQMPFYLLIPADLKEGEKRTAVIACHGHSSNGKEAVAGVRKNEIMTNTIEHYHYNYGEILAQKGYVVLVPDARGFGERRERYDQGDTEEKILSSSCSYLNVMAMSLGQTVMGMWLWDLMRLADYALSLEIVNGHLACVGLSGGGMQSLWLSAMDERIECSVISGYFYGYLESLLINYNCLCNYVPNLWKVVDIGDIGALIAPRPVLIETGNQDDLNGRSGLENVYPQVETIKRAMKLFGVEDHLYHDVFEGEHRWHGEKAYSWLLSHVPPKMEEKL
jgi:dienelactone hydrolase